ncbi:MAG TPA: Rid family hydrolase [Pseudolysinimonas sp.]|jgi:enamine deaminase RidA (YjgF/YER057c/UK114 family)
MSGTIPEHWNPDAVAAPIGKYSHLTRVPAGSELLFIAGQVGNDTSGAIPGDVYQQTLLVLGNVEALLDSAGLTPANLIRLLSFVAGTEALPGYYAARDEIYARWFPDAVYPGHSLAVVAALAQPSLFVELEGWAAIPAR